MMLAVRGDTVEARRLQEQALQIHRRLQNKDGIAASLWGLARLDMTAFDWESAGPRLAESWMIFSEIGRAEGIAAVGSVFGQLLGATEVIEEARHVLNAAEDPFRRLGLTGEAAEVAQLLTAIDLRESQADGGSV